MQKAMKNRITAHESETVQFDVSAYKPIEKVDLIRYMEAFEPYAAAGRIIDCVTGERLKEDNVGYTDGVFMWTSQDIYHIKKYNAAVSDAFIRRITN